jgi:effector-binding domain-containing protein
MACLVHHGAYNQLSLAYQTLVGWLEASGYRIAGPNRELYLHFSTPAHSDDESYVTEIQFPIAPVSHPRFSVTD